MSTDTQLPVASPPSPRRGPSVSGVWDKIRRSPVRAASWILLAGLVFFLLYPLVGVLWQTYGPSSPSVNFGSIGDRLLPVLSDTAIIVVGSTVLAVIIGVLLAWAHERTDGNLGWVGEILPLSTLIIPAVAGVVGWIILFDPKIGYVNAILRWLLGLFGVHLDDGPINVYSLPMLIVVSAVYLVPYVFLLMTSALQVLNSSMEEASRVSGASSLRTFIRILLPALAPSLGASVIISVIRSLTTFVVIAVIGTRAGVETLPVYIYHLMGGFPPNTGLAVLLAFGLMIAIQLLLVLQSRVNRAGRFATVGGKGGGVRRTKLGPMRPVVKGLTASYLVVTCVLPALAILLVSVQPFWSATVDLGHLTFATYQSMFSGSGATSDAIRNSLLLAAGGATAVMLTAVVIMVAQRESSKKFRRFSSSLMSLPAMLPHSLVGVAFIVAFTPRPFSLYGTVALLFLAYVLMELPYAGQTTAAVLNSVAKELPEASRVFGAGELRTFGRIMLPLMLPGLAAGWIVIFIHMMS
jgi:iron(III) transport system permease protein